MDMSAKITLIIEQYSFVIELRKLVKLMKEHYLPQEFYETWEDYMNEKPLSDEVVYKILLSSLNNLEPNYPWELTVFGGTFALCKDEADHHFRVDWGHLEAMAEFLNFLDPESNYITIEVIRSRYNEFYEAVFSKGCPESMKEYYDGTYLIPDDDGEYVKCDSEYFKSILEIIDDEDQYKETQYYEIIKLIKIE